MTTTHGPRGKGRDGRPWRTIAQRVYREETHCWICGQYVDQTLPPRTPRSRSVDHVVPLSQGGNPLDRANLRLACLGCNSSRHQQQRKQQQPRRRRATNSQRW